MHNDPRGSLLIVDDSATNLLTMRGILGDAYQVRFAQSGPAALAQLAAGDQPDLILLDVMMPEMDGYAVCAALQADPATREIPVIFITARADSASETQALAAGGVDFIHKPLNAAVLGARVALHLALRRQTQALRAANAELSQHRDHLEELVAARTRELAVAREAAESANRAKSAFLAAVGHELRTPIHQIMGTLHVVKRKLTDPSLRDWLVKGEDAARRLRHLIDDVLQYTKSEAAATPLTAGDFALADLLAEVVRRVRPAAEDKGLALTVTVEAAVPAWLKGDPVLLQRLLGLLLDNAVKFSEQGCITLSVASHPAPGAATGGAPELRFEVADQGIGLAPDLQERLFQLFEQGETGLTRRYGGTGLGLALARRLVALMGGMLGCASVPGHGSRFWVALRLPVGAAPTIPPDAPATADPERRNATVATLAQRLGEADLDALRLWSEAESWLGPVLGTQRNAFENALLGCDFEDALRLLREAMAATPPGSPP